MGVKNFRVKGALLLLLFRTLIYLELGSYGIPPFPITSPYPLEESFSTHFRNNTALLKRQPFDSFTQQQLSASEITYQNCIRKRKAAYPSPTDIHPHPMYF